MFGDERPSYPDLAQIMQDWVKQYRGYVSMEYYVNSYFATRLHIIARPSIGNAFVVGYFAVDFREITLVDRFGKTIKKLIPEDPSFFSDLDAHVEEIIGPSHG